jgi:hypothetical protein
MMRTRTVLRFFELSEDEMAQSRQSKSILKNLLDFVAFEVKYSRFGKDRSDEIR